MKFHTIPDAVQDISNGKMIIVVDNEDRENEGDLVMASELITPDAVNFMAREARGLICVSISEKRAKGLYLEQMNRRNTSLHETAFTVSVDAKNNTTTGISAFDRAETIRVLISENSSPDDLAKPGHIFPIVGKEGGVLRRAGHTEASMDLSVLAGLKASGVICEIMSKDGSMARRDELLSFANNHNLKIISISDLIRYRRKVEAIVSKVEQVNFPTLYGDFQLHLFDDLYGGGAHLALTLGEVGDKQPNLVRVHSECLTGDVFGSQRCDCGAQLDLAMKTISDNGSGIIVYLRQEGRGIGLKHKIQAYKLQEDGMDTVEANEKLGFPPDMRDYGVGAEILKNLGAKELIVMTNNPKKLIGLEGYGLNIVDRIPIVTTPTNENSKYLKTKKEKLNHKLEL
mgnify:FL=1|tara:strand:- start:1239 stop:2438 length:1200 start_codon:yes stop_codon:yes gene_type:complete